MTYSGLTSRNILELQRGISYDDAKKVALRLEIPLNSIDNIRSTHTDPELYGHALISEWLKNHEGSERDAINQLAMAFRDSNLGSYAAKLQSLVCHPPHVQLPVAPRPVTTTIRDHKGCTKRDIAYILANCDDCKDFEMCKRVLVKGIKSGMVTCHLRYDGCTGFKLVNAKHDHHLKRCPTCHQHIYLKYHQTRTHHMIRRLRCHLTLGQHKHLKRLLAHSRRRHFQLRPTHDQHIRHHTSNSSTDANIESWSNLGTIVSTPSSGGGGDIITSPIPFPTPNGDMTPPDYTLQQIHSATETVHEAHDVPDSPLTPFPTPRKEDDFITPSKHGPQQESALAEEKLKVFVITEIGRCDFKTIALVGRCLLGDDEYESIIKRARQEHPKRMIVNQIFEGWKKHEGDINFHKLLKTFRAIHNKELIKKTQVFLRRQARLFSNEKFVH